MVTGQGMSGHSWGQDEWAVIGEQFITYLGVPVAMADTPARARMIVVMLNAQAVGGSAVERVFEERLVAVREEFEAQLVVAEQRADDAERRRRRAVAELREFEASGL